MTIPCMLILCIGCSEPEPIVTYTIPTRVPDQLLPEQDRMLAVMLPKDDKVWFFKITGPESAIESVESDLRDFVKTLQFDGDNPDLSDLPSEWQLGGNKPMRFASIDVNTPTKQLDLSVSNLSRPRQATDDAWKEYVDLNVNRWRGQLGLAKSNEDLAGGESIEIASADGDSVWVDIVGELGASMSPPFANNPHGDSHPPFAGSASNDPPADNTASSGTASQSAPKNEPSDRLKFDRPEGWRDGKMSSMRMAAFNVGPEDSPAEITVIAAGGDLRGNVKRWIGQVLGEPPTDKLVDQALKEAEKIEVSGRAAQRFVLTPEKLGDDSDNEKAIDATIVPMAEGFHLFVKMTGPPATVTNQYDSIAEFLASLKF